MRRGRVLVVDDESLIRWSINEHLSRAGFEVEEAETGELALEALARFSPDLMLLDVRLPGMDGPETLRLALDARPDLAVVMMSAHGTVNVAVEAMKAGALDFLTKPFAMEQLDTAVGRALAAASTRRKIVDFGGTPDGERPQTLIGDSAAMEQIRGVITGLGAANTSTVLIEGESGTGKEVVALAIHHGSSRAKKPFLQVNCAALAETLLDSELFGHEKGAFTDARTQKRGIFESAAGGTVFLDEIGDLPASGQAKLLRLLENRTFRRVGGNEELTADVRVIAATNVDLEERVTEGSFRTDLYFRLNVVCIETPPLREHLEDVPSLVAHFVARFNAAMKRGVGGVAPEAMAVLRRYGWPGNVRELRNVVERAFAMHGSMDEIRLEHLPPAIRNTPVPQHAEGGLPGSLDVRVLEDTERTMLNEALRRSGGNQSKAARMLGISRYMLRYRLRKFGIEG
jgi:DNA-binding NtrC family response regulator